MSRSTHILLVTLAVLCLQQDIKAASDPEKLETLVDIFLFADINDYLKVNSGIKLEALQNVNNVGHTLGVRQEGDKKLINSYGATHVASGYLPLYPVRFGLESKMEITYVVVRFPDNVNGGKAFLIGGEIGQSFISLLIESPSKIEGIQQFELLVYGRAAEN